MRAARAVHDAICVAVIVFGVVYALPLLVKLPALWYLPLERTWMFAPAPRGLGMDWYGRSLAAAFAAFAGAGLTWLVVRRRTSRSARSAQVLVIAAALVLVSAGAIYVDHLIRRTF